ncbi:hypothetical protein CVT26_010025 [Gymnopilus dilepis]|uniref:Uncharacterized protein n=1 Tax=Gymnopilus dilepis TaxID=231916 RepID=A0A409VKZ2_9AGAR|nr:hypothetical protein CVT26_010025 [Gymnopilus dilepis]
MELRYLRLSIVSQVENNNNRDELNKPLPYLHRMFANFPEPVAAKARLFWCLLSWMEVHVTTTLVAKDCIVKIDESDISVLFEHVSFGKISVK